jgi:hypothetical protein
MFRAHEKARATIQVNLSPGRNARVQAEQLNELLQKKVEHIGNAEAVRLFVTSRFQARMASHLTRAPWLGYAHTALGVTAIMAGVATSTLAAGAGPDANSTLVVVLGLLVAGTTALNQIFKFAKRSAARFRAGNQLRQQAWDYIFGRGCYAEKSDKDAFFLFYSKIWAIEAPVDASVEFDEEGARS